MTALKTKIILQWLQIAAGLFVFSFGEHLTIFANIGLAPWDCLGMGIAILRTGHDSDIRSGCLY